MWFYVGVGGWERTYIFGGRGILCEEGGEDIYLD